MKRHLQNNRWERRKTCWARSVVQGVVFFAVFATVATASAQNSSLLTSTSGGSESKPVLTLEKNSWTYQKPVEPHPIRLHDIVTMTVDEKSVMISEGQMDRKKKAYGDLKLPNWVLFKGLSMVPDPQTAGDPHVRGEVDNKMNSKGSLETRDSLKFRIACEIVDIRPNGILVLEAKKRVQNNSEIWEYSLTGEIRPEDVLPNNTVMSENVSNLRLSKQEEGHVRDSYRRGWMLKWLDKYQPF